MILPSSPVKMMLLYRPITSMVKVRVTWSPSSLMASKSKWSRRSSSGWRMAVSFAPQQLFAQQHAQHGRLLGVSRGMVVKCTRAELALAENRHAVGRLPGAEGHHQLLPVGLMDFIHPGPQEAALQFLFDMPQKRAVQCHKYGCPFSDMCYRAPMGAASAWESKKAVSGTRLRR